MRALRKLSHYKLWQVDENGTDSHAKLFETLKKYLILSTNFLNIPIDNFPSLEQKQSLLSAIKNLAHGCGLRAEINDNFNSLNLSNNIPIIAKERLSNNLILLLPIQNRQYQVYDQNASPVYQVIDKKISALFDDLIQLYPSQKLENGFSIHTLSKKLNTYLPKTLLFFLALVKLFFLIAFLLAAVSNIDTPNFSMSLLAVCLFCAFLFCDYLNNVVFAKNNKIAKLWTLDQFYQKIFSLPCIQLNKISLDQISNLTQKIRTDSRLYFLKTFKLLFLLLAVLSIILLVFLIDTTIAFVLLIITGIYLFLFVRINKTRKFYLHESKLLRNNLADVLDNIDITFDALVGLNARGHLYKKLAKLHDKLRYFEVIDFRLKFLLILINIVLFLSMLVFLSLSLNYLNPEKLDLSIIILGLVLSFIYSLAISYLAKNLNSYPQAAISKSTREYFNSLPAQVKSDHVKIVNLHGSIELTDVSFHYPEHSSLILKNTNIKISAQKFYLISGASGLGKSTLLKVLMAEIFACRGQVVFDGQDVLSLDLADLKKNFGVVRQNTSLFLGSILSNITCGRDIEPRKLQDLLLRHEAFDYLLDLPMGLQTYVFEHGKNLSRLEQVLLFLARALVNNPKILFLDEIFLGIPQHEQKLISSFLHELPMTKILVSHDEKNIYKADEIIYLSNF